MATHGSVDYATSYFKYKTPTPIWGQPTHKALQRLKNELQANASSVETELGGGDHGYLGLVLSDTDYANVPYTCPFEAPTFPSALTIPATATAVQSATRALEGPPSEQLVVAMSRLLVSTLR